MTFEDAVIESIKWSWDHLSVKSIDFAHLRALGFVVAPVGGVIDKTLAARAAEKANAEFGQWMPERWLWLFVEAYAALARSASKGEGM